MNSRNILIVIILIVAMIFLKSHISKSMEIQRSGNNLSITSGRHTISASIIGGQRTESFLVFGGSKNSDLDFAFPFSVIEFNTANRLAQRYGDFFRCASPGASEAKKSIKSLFLYPENSDIERSLKSIDKLTMNDKSPVVKMTYVELLVTDHKMIKYGQESQLDYRGNFISCLVKEVQLIEEDMSL